MPEWIDLKEVAGAVASGSSLALGGSHRLAPLALVREVIRQGKKDLHLITTPTGGFAVELLAAAGTLKKVQTAQVSLGELGLAPAFRNGVEEGRIHVTDGS